MTNGVNGYTFLARITSALAEVMRTLTEDVEEWDRTHAAIRLDGTHLDMFDEIIAT